MRVWGKLVWYIKEARGRQPQPCHNFRPWQSGVHGPGLIWNRSLCGQLHGVRVPIGPREL